MSVHLLPRHSRPSSRSMMRIPTIMSSVSVIISVLTVEEIARKKSKTVAGLLVVTDICIEAFEARARLLESHGKGPSRKKEDREVNTADRGDQKDRGGHRYYRK
jgi:hypothetical protein